MNCPNCRTKMRCNDSRQLDDFTRWRVYKCPGCNSKEYSREGLIVDKKVKNDRLKFKRTEST